MNETFAALVASLGVDCCAVFEAHDLDVDLVAAFGMPDAVAGATRGTGGRYPQTRYTLATTSPVIIDDLREETPFDAAEMLRFGLISGVTAVITVDGARWGVLGAYTTTSPRAWGDDALLVQVAADLLGLATERTRHDEARERDRRREPLAALGQLAAGVAHDFNNIVAAISLYTELLETQQGLNDAGREYIAAVRQQVERGASLVWQVLDFAHRSTLMFVDVDLAGFLEQLVPLLRRTLPGDIRLSLSHDGRPHLVRADPTRLQQIFMNVVSNANHAIDGPGEVTITLRRHGVDADEESPLDNPLRRPSVSVDIIDSGKGMAPDVAARAFEAFFTTKSPDRGTGLGLAQVHGLVDQHDGHVELISGAGEGTTISIWLPAAAAPDPAPATARAEIPIGQGEAVLVVDEDPAVREAMASVLKWLGYTTTVADSVPAAWAILAESGNAIAVVVSDVAMPGSAGETLAKMVARRSPRIPVILVSGYPPAHHDLVGPPSADLEAGLTRLLKPFSSRELAEAMRTALHRS